MMLKIWERLHGTVGGVVAGLVLCFLWGVVIYVIEVYRGY
jgi:hypothetical protein